jgi:hypothetical protein
VIIIEKNVAEPIRGYLVDANEVRVIVDVLLPNGETRQRILPRTSIEEMIEAVSREKLESLSSDRPQDYRDYAEELAGKTNDPDAQRTAIRLYQIAAYLAPEKLGRSCLLGMVALARNSEEERKFRAAAYLLDSEHDRTVLRGSKSDRVAKEKLTDEQRTQLRGLLRALREGRARDARSFAQRPAVQESLKHITSILNPSDFSEMRNGEPLAPGQLVQVLAAELAIDPEASPAPADPSLDGAPRPASGWSKITDPKLTRPVPVLTLELLTEFDPRQCHYRNGKWER